MAIPAFKAHLAFVSHRFECNDGQGRVNYEIVRAALADGYRVTVLASRCDAAIADHPHARYIALGNEKLPTALLRNLVFARHSARWLRRYRNELDLVQVNGFVTWERGDIAAAHFVHTSWKANRYYPFVGLSPYNLYQRIFTILNARWEKKAFIAAAKVVAVSNQVGRELRDLGVPSNRIEVINNGVDSTQFCPGAPARESFGLPLDVPLSLFVGDIKTPRKNLETLLKALQSVPELHLVVAGSAEGSPYPALAQQLGVRDRVLFLGKIKEMPALMRSVDLVVFPSRYDPFGLVVLEAMASGVPVISSITAGIADYIGDAGLLLQNPEDVAELSKLITDILSDGAKRTAMGVSGRRRALAMQWSGMTDRYLELYKTVLSLRPRACRML